MFDHLHSETRDETLDLARCFFFDHGHDLAAAAALLGGAHGEARVVSCGLHVEAASRMTHRIQRELIALHRLISLADVGDPDRLETELFSAVNPASPEVESICLLTDLLEELLSEIDTVRSRQSSEPAKRTTSAA